MTKAHALAAGTAQVLVLLAYGELAPDSELWVDVVAELRREMTAEQLGRLADNLQQLAKDLG